MSWQPGDPLPEPGPITRQTAVALYARDGCWPWWALDWRSLSWFVRWQALGDVARRDYLADLAEKCEAARENNELSAPRKAEMQTQIAAKFSKEERFSMIANAEWG